MNAEDSLLIDIKGTFEIAIARNRLRQMAARHHCPLMLQARAAAAITSIAELVLFQANQNHHFQLSIFIRNEQEKQGIEFQFFAPLQSGVLQNFTIAEWQLKQSCDEVEINNRGENDYVIMRLWTRRKPA